MNRKFLGLIIVLLAAVVLPAQWATAGSALPNAVAPVSLIPGEPNDTFGAAIPFDLYAHENAKGYFLTAADVDFYRIEAATPVELTAIATTGYAFGHTTMTAEIAIYDATHTLVTQNTGCNDPAETITTLSEGTAFVRVRPCAAGLDIDKDYRLEIYADALEMEPNNTRETANGGFAPYNEYVNYNVWQSGAVSPSGDVDFYRIQDAADQAFHAQVDAAEGTAPLSLALMAADGTILAEGAPCW
ncbi:MAG TPA: hypothetical protein PLR07_12715, partial [Promineifilum sp.]|nr:hypothetical protein [Promineifilum sp.]